jgi:hypothetical protein
MSGMSNQTGSGEKSRSKKKHPVDLNTARRMLPLVQRIITDIVQDTEDLDRYTFEQEGLDRNKVQLSWPERQRRYAVQSEVTRLQTRLDENRRELDSLGAVLVSRGKGSVGFPTLIHGKPAYFSWQLGEDGVNFWYFDGESTRRPIPPAGFDSGIHRTVSQR